MAQLLSDMDNPTENVLEKEPDSIEREDEKMNSKVLPIKQH